MRKLIIAGVIAVATASAAQSEGIMNGGIMSMIKPDASVEYGIKTKKWSGDVGVTASLSRLSVRPALDWGYASGDSIAISGASVKSTLAISNSLSAYSKLSLDKDFKYTDLSIGVAIAFK
tara:strand:+ start:403 stop:762 length:360 start_codon:yes stop_codon:yes gene_type:complete